MEQGVISFPRHSKPGHLPIQGRTIKLARDQQERLSPTLILTEGMDVVKHAEPVPNPVSAALLNTDDHSGTRLVLPTPTSYNQPATPKPAAGCLV